MISWRCPTYKREKYLPNIVRCFRNQDYKGKMELVIVNDDPGVELVSGHGQIRIYNLDYRFTNIYEKMDYSTHLCRGDIIIPVSDDDEFKPWATSMLVDKLGNDRFCACKGYFKKIAPDKLLFRDETISGLYICQKSLWEELGDKIHGHHYFFNRVKEAGLFKSFECTEEDAFFIWDKTSDHSNWGKKIINITEGGY